MPKKSRDKGKRGEREAVKWLKSLGYASARRTQQYNGDGLSDVVCDELPGLHIEVKFGVVGMDIGTALLAKACEQAENDANEKRWVVLWKPPRKEWRLTLEYYGRLVTLDGEEACELLKEFDGPLLTGGL